VNGGIVQALLIMPRNSIQLINYNQMQPLAWIILCTCFWFVCV